MVKLQHINVGAFFESAADWRKQSQYPCLSDALAKVYKDRTKEWQGLNGFSLCA